jgi:hypothetical protein
MYRKTFSPQPCSTLETEERLYSTPQGIWRPSVFSRLTHIDTITAKMHRGVGEHGGASRQRVQASALCIPGSIC